jgi:membrane-associated phospholipid phosphatase
MNISKQKSANKKTLLIISALSLACFLVIALSLSLFVGVNQSVNSWATSIQSAALTQAAKAISYGFETNVLLAVSVVITGFLVYRKQAGNALLLLGAMGADAVVLYLSKALIESPRPLNGLLIEGGNSFPSGHLTSTIVLFGMLSYLAWKNHKPAQTKALVGLTVALALVVGFDRIYLNVHWFTDALAAPFMAGFLLAVSIRVIEHLIEWYQQRHEAGAAKPHQFSKSNVWASPLRLRRGTLYGRAITNQPNNRGSVE